MKRWIVLLCFGLLILAGPTIAGAQEPGPRTTEELEAVIEELQQRLDYMRQRVESLEESGKKLAAPETFRAYWKEGLRFETLDKKFKMQIGGRIMNDWTWWNDDDPSEVETFLEESLEDGSEFRRARLFVSGQLYERLKFKAQYDFAGGDAEFKDVYMELTKLGILGNLRVGHFKEPFSLEELTSSKYIQFLERGLPNAFAPSRNVGLMFHDHEFDGRMTWAIGMFRDADGFGESANEGGGEYNLTLRVTGLPWYENKGRQLLHLGLGYTHRSPHEDTVRFRQRPEVHLSPRFVNTGHLAADAEDRLGAEAAVVFGPLSFQGEYMFSAVDALETEDPTFSGYYIQGSYFLTGENRKYKTSSGAFDRVKPKRNFIPGKSGPGAWEVALRYSRIDLNDEEINGGQLDDVTLGLTWHLNPNTRVMWNYVLADLERVDNVQAFTMRFQLDF